MRKNIPHLPWRKIQRWRDKEWAERRKKIYGIEKIKKHDIKENKKIRIQNRKLCKKYPWLIPRNRFTGKISWVRYPYDNTELDDMPKGWRIAFGDIWCEEIQKILVKNHYVNRFRIIQLKEKYGSFRQYTNGHTKEMSDLIWAFEIISEYICIRCGKLHSPVINNYGWYEPICKDCYEKQKLKTSAYSEKLKEAKIENINDMKIPTSFTLSILSKDGDQKRTVDINWLVNKIIYKNRKRRTNIEQTSS